MKALAVAVIVFAAMRFVAYNYNLPSCGTAMNCGVPIHDALHWIVGR